MVGTTSYIAIDDFIGTELYSDSSNGAVKYHLVVMCITINDADVHIRKSCVTNGGDNPHFSTFGGCFS